MEFKLQAICTGCVTALGQARGTLSPFLAYENIMRSSPYPVVRLTRSHTAFSSHLRARLRDWVIGLGQTGCNSWAALSSNDSDTRYITIASVVHQGSLLRFRDR